ncbi:PorT family protein [Pedobacter sp. MC2016-14]|uniref:outer membrane beta-barrel protein n=1 Tax=Pedobacter sp. MC2016-14 TaxID=2897327 RepID=UPI001E3491E8|nr:outer membrane beta-barrel protein [Pedobacter sp. MC2016-14]MCD0488378.1 PorT family protein [Pedobacter sp. MC2016-14]
MKAILLTAVLMTGAFFQHAVAQQDTTGVIVTDTTIVKKKKFSASWDFGNRRDSTKRDITSKKPYKPGFVGGITLTRIDLGFSRLLDNGSFKLSAQNDFLDYKDAKTSTFSFDVIDLGYRFNPHFKLLLAGGFDWTLIRLKKNITIQEDQPALNYINEPIAFSKNRFSSSYFHIPLSFQFRTKENDRGKRVYFVVGPEASFLLNGKVKQKSEERGKEKFRDDYNFQSVRYGGTVRLGYGSFGIFTKYYFNDMFETAAQAGLKNMSFGLTWGMN